MCVAHGCVVTLVNQVFLGFHIVIKAGFCQSQLVGDVTEGSRARALGIKKLGRPRQYGRVFRFVLDTAIEGRTVFGDCAQSEIIRKIRFFEL